MTPAEYLLLLQHKKKSAEIADALQECNRTWDESVELFQNAGPGVIRFTNKPGMVTWCGKVQLKLEKVYKTGRFGINNFISDFSHFR